VRAAKGPAISCPSSMTLRPASGPGAVGVAWEEAVFVMAPECAVPQRALRGAGKHL
jgi:hypothetical protein